MINTISQSEAHERTEQEAISKEVAWLMRILDALETTSDIHGFLNLSEKDKTQNVRDIVLSKQPDIFDWETTYMIGKWYNNNESTWLTLTFKEQNWSFSLKISSETTDFPQSFDEIPDIYLANIEQVQAIHTQMIWRYSSYTPENITNIQTEQQDTEEADLLLEQLNSTPRTAKVKELQATMDWFLKSHGTLTWVDAAYHDDNITLYKHPDGITYHLRTYHNGEEDSYELVFWQEGNDSIVKIIHNNNDAEIDYANYEAADLDSINNLLQQLQNSIQTIQRQQLELIDARAGIENQSLEDTSAIG